MRIFKDKLFARFARRHRIADADLCEAVERAGRGLIDADLGGGVIKQRIARPGAGRSGGFRTIIFFRIEERAFFVFGFAKNDADNISDEDLKIFKSAAKTTLSLPEATIQMLLTAEELIEVNCDDEENNDDDQDL